MAKYLKINGKVSKDKWQSMFRYFAKYVKSPLFITDIYADGVMEKKVDADNSTIEMF